MWKIFRIISKWIFEYLFWILKEFSIDDASKVASIVWNFGDPATGVNNTSTDLSPFHDFSIDGSILLHHSYW
jgi:hypothetical protein